MIELTQALGLISLRGELTRDSVATLQSALLELPLEAETTTLDLSEIGELDSAGLQLLASFVRGRPGAQLTNPSAAVSAFCGRFGGCQALFAKP